MIFPSFISILYLFAHHFLGISKGPKVRSPGPPPKNPVGFKLTIDNGTDNQKLLIIG